MSEQPDLPPSFNPTSYRRASPRDQEKAETRRLGLIVAGIVGFLVVVVAAREFFVHRGPSEVASDGSPPVITASGAPVKVAPANPGGLQVPGADQDVLGSGASGAGPANGQLAPGPEAPAPDKLAAQTPTASAIEPPPPVALPTPGPAVKQPPARFASPTPESSVPLAEQHPFRPEEGARLAPPSAVALTQVGRTEVQLAALPTETAARHEWHRLQAKLPGVLSGHSAHIIPVVLNGHTVYRLRTGGFLDRAEARRFCEKIRSQGAACGIY